MTMNEADVKRVWLDRYREVAEDAQQCHCDGQAVPSAMLELYDRLSEAEKEHVHSVLRRWLISGDNKLRYGAKFIVSQRRVRSLRTAIDEAAGMLAGEGGAEARFDAEDLRRISRELA